MKPQDAHLIYDRVHHALSLYLGSGEFRHSWQARNDAVGNPAPDPYGYECPMPPGVMYTLGVPDQCGPGSPDGVAYGWWAIPITDNPAGDLAAHGRAGIMIHGGGTASPAPFSDQQGWFPTLGCIRMQNVDLGMQVPAQGTLVDSVLFIQRAGTVYLDVIGANPS